MKHRTYVYDLKIIAPIFLQIVAASANRKAGIEHCITVTGDQLAAMNVDSSDVSAKWMILKSFRFFGIL